MERSTSLKLRPADPFDLIRWLARSQSDPRKAVAEMSVANGTSNLSIEAWCDPSWLAVNLKDHSLIVSDCEGYEGAVFCEQMVPASTGMLLAWALGATAGPILASQAMTLCGDWALFLYLAAVAGLLAVFVRFRMSRRVALPAEEQARFAPRGDCTVVAGALDPRPSQAGAAA